MGWIWATRGKKGSPAREESQEYRSRGRETPTERGKREGWGGRRRGGKRGTEGGTVGLRDGMTEGGIEGGRNGGRERGWEGQTYGRTNGGR